MAVLALAPNLNPTRRAGYLKVASTWLAERLCCSLRWLISSPEGISASSALLRTVPCCGGSFCPVFSVLSRVIFPKIVVTWWCLWEEMNSESAYATILMRSLKIVFLIYFSNFSCWLYVDTQLIFVC